MAATEKSLMRRNVCMGVRDMGFGLRVRIGISKQSGALLLGLRLVHSGLHWRPVCVWKSQCVIFSSFVSFTF